MTPVPVHIVCMISFIRAIRIVVGCMRGDLAYHDGVCLPKRALYLSVSKCIPTRIHSYDLGRSPSSIYMDQAWF